MHHPTSSAPAAATPTPLQRRAAAAAILSAAIARLLRAGEAPSSSTERKAAQRASPFPLEDSREARLSVRNVPAGEGGACLETQS